MAGIGEQDERTFMPTPLRLAEARRRGQVARSADLAAVGTTFAVIFLLGFLAPRLMGEMRQMTAALLEGGTVPTRLPASTEILAAISPALWTLAPVLALAVLAAVLVNVVQIGFVATTETFRMDFGRLRPANGTRRVFSLRSLVRLSLSVAKLLAVGATVFCTLHDGFERILASAALSVSALADEAGWCMYNLCLRVCGVLFVLALLDWLYQRWQHVQDLKMTRREWLEDLRRMEGDPRIRNARRKQARRNLANAAGEKIAAATGGAKTDIPSEPRTVRDDSRMNYGRRVDYIG